jgi:hypothetical protein
MRVKLKCALPLVHMTLAVVLFWRNDLWINASRGQDMPGPSPAFTLLLEAICMRYPQYLPLPWRIPTYASVLIWSLAPMFIFGRDLVYCVRRKSPKIGN